MQSQPLATLGRMLVGIALTALGIQFFLSAHSVDEWTSLFHAVAFAGASMVIACMNRKAAS